jgi:hypothetical protein
MAFSIVAAVIGASLSIAVPSRASPTSIRDAQNAEIIAYQDAHPDDLVGLDALVRKYTSKSIQVGFSGMKAALNASEAESHLRAWHASKSASRSSDALATPGSTVSPMALPSNTFTAWIVETPLVGPPAQARYNGRWDFKDSFAGQSSPVDVAALEFDMPSCMHMVNHGVSTYSVTGTNTRLGSLRTANVAAKAPIWNIADRTSGFQNLADHGAAGVTIQKYCTGSTDVAADFSYEFNQGGSVISVTAGWGFLSVSYSGTDQHLQKGSSIIYDTF